MTTPILMPKAKAVWLYDNTMLQLDQIATFCGLHVLDVRALADGEGSKITGQSPVMDGDVTEEEIKRCEADAKAKLQRTVKSDRPAPVSRAKGPRYTPVSKRADKPNAVLYLLKHHPELIDAQIVRLVGTTKNTIKAIREKTHADYANLTPMHPAECGLCTMEEFGKTIEKARKARPSAAQPEETGHAHHEKSGVALEDNAFDFSAFLGNRSGSANDEHEHGNDHDRDRDLDRHDLAVGDDD